MGNGAQVTYKAYNVNGSETVNTTGHGQRDGSPKLRADLNLTRGDRITKFKASKGPSSRVDFLQITTEKVQDNKVVTSTTSAGNFFAAAVERTLPIFGFYGATKDEALVSLGFYSLEDTSVPQGKTELYGGGFNTSWDDSEGNFFQGAAQPSSINVETTLPCASCPESFPPHHDPFNAVASGYQKGDIKIRLWHGLL